MRRVAEKGLWDESSLRVDESVSRARAMHQRVLRCWAMDVLALRSRGLDRPSLREGVSPAAPMARAA